MVRLHVFGFFYFLFFIFGCCQYMNLSLYIYIYIFLNLSFFMATLKKIPKVATRFESHLHKKPN